MRNLIVVLFLSFLVCNVSANEHLIKDDVDGKLQEQKNLKKPILSDHLKFLQDDYDLSLILSYMTVGQYDAISEEDGAGDRVDFTVHYRFKSNLSFATKIEMEGQFGEYSSGGYKNAIGSYNTLSPGYADLDPYIKELWTQYKFESLSVRAGIINTNSFVDKSFYNNFVKFYMSHASSSQSFGNIPLSSLGVGVKYTQKDYYINAVLSDATAHLEDAVDDIKDNDLTPYATVEVGLTADKNIYFVNIWSKTDKNDDKSYGMYLSLNQYLDEYNKVYMKYGISEDTAIKQHASVGWSHSTLFDPNDLLLTALTTSQNDVTSEFQNTLEILYKYKFDYGIELSGDMQVIQNLDDTKTEDIAMIMGARLRVVF